MLINRSPVGNILPTHGIRQGDHISLYLYLICTEGFSALIQKRTQTQMLKSFKASRSGPEVSHLLFADDSLVFCKAEEEDCKTLLDILDIYAKESGQRVNFQKPAITFGKGVPDHMKSNLTQLTGIIKIGGFGRYLGLPETIGRNKYDKFSFIKQRIMKKLESWYTILLSPAGKEVLIKAVATA